MYEVAQRYGTHSPYWQARVRGEFPEQGDEDALISLKWLDAAKAPRQQASNAPLFAGIDVAGPGEEETVLTIRRSACVILQKWWVERSSGHVLAEMAKFGGASAFRAVNIDSAGLGKHFCEIIELPATR